MRLTDRDRVELGKAIGEQLHYFEWVDQHPGEVPDPQAWKTLRKNSAQLLLNDARFLTKVRSLLDRIEFTLVDSRTVQQRQDEAITQYEHAAQMLSASLKYDKSTILEDLLRNDYR